MTTPPHATKEPHAKLSDPLRAPTPRCDAIRDATRYLGIPDELERLYAEARRMEEQLTASLRALEEKNELLLVAETALEEIASYDLRYSGAENVGVMAIQNARAALARIRAAKKGTHYGEAPREHVEEMAKQFREQFRDQSASVPRSQTSGGMEGERK